MRAHLDRILEGPPCRVVVVASDGQISRANPEALRLVGFNPNSDAPASGSVATLPSAVRRLLECAQGRRRTGAERPGRGRRNALAGRAPCRHCRQRGQCLGLYSARWERAQAARGNPRRNCSASKRWRKCPPYWLMKSVTRSAASNCLRDCWRNPISTATAGNGWSVCKLGCVLWSPP